MRVDELIELLGKEKPYLKVAIALPDGTGEIEPLSRGGSIDHQTYGWLTLESEWSK
jgi:hypothetical protein